MEASKRKPASAESAFSRLECRAATRWPSVHNRLFLLGDRQNILRDIEYPKPAVAVAHLNTMGQFTAIHFTVVGKIDFARILVLERRRLESEETLILPREIPFHRRGGMFGLQHFGVDAQVGEARRDSLV